VLRAQGSLCKGAVEGRETEGFLPGGFLLCGGKSSVTACGGATSFKKGGLGVRSGLKAPFVRELSSRARLRVFPTCRRGGPAEKKFQTNMSYMAKNACQMLEWMIS